jgi:hypothetical protein
VESHHLLTGLLPVARLADLRSRVQWRLQRGSNPHFQIDNLVSWPLDDGGIDDETLRVWDLHPPRRLMRPFRNYLR